MNAFERALSSFNFKAQCLYDKRLVRKPKTLAQVLSNVLIMRNKEIAANIAANNTLLTRLRSIPNAPSRSRLP